MSESDGWDRTLAEEHARLDRLLERADALIAQRPDAATVERLLPLLRHLATTCRRHMDFEESGGYLTPVLERLPNMSKTIESLRSEHGLLLDQLADMIDAAARRPDVAALKRDLFPRLSRWILELRLHEEQENTLVQEAFNTDLGGGD